MGYLRLYTTPNGWSILLNYEWDGVKETRRKPWERPLRRIIHALQVEGPKQFIPATYGASGYCAHWRTVGPYNITKSNESLMRCPITDAERSLLASAADQIRAHFSNDPETKTPPWDMPPYGM